MLRGSKMYEYKKGRTLKDLEEYALGGYKDAKEEEILDIPSRPSEFDLMKKEARIHYRAALRHVDRIFKEHSFLEAIPRPHRYFFVVSLFLSPVFLLFCCCCCCGKSKDDDVKVRQAPTKPVEPKEKREKIE